MTFLFKIRIYDRHETQEEDDYGEERVKKKDDDWLRFDLYIEVGKLLIKDFREYVLWQDNNENPIKCVKITFTDDSYVYGAYTIETFLKTYNEDYKRVYQEWYDKFYTPNDEGNGNDVNLNDLNVAGNNSDNGKDDDEGEGQ